MLTRHEYIDRYCTEHGLDRAEIDADQLAVIEKAYKRYYNREKKRESRNRYHEVTIAFDLPTYNRVRTAAKHHSSPVSLFVRATALAYLDKTFVLPDDTRLKEVVYQIRKVGNLINQWTKLAHQTGNVDPAVIQAMRDQLGELEAFVRQTLTDPRDLLDLVREATDADPSLGARVEAILSDLSPK